MKITCPQCQFSREVAEHMLPDNVRSATCPSCQHRFKLERPTADLTSTQEDFAFDTTNTREHTNIINNIEEEPIQPAQHADIPTEDRQKVVAAYQEQSSSEEEGPSPDQEQAFAAFAIQNPWDNIQNNGFISAFSQTLTRIFFAAPRFFAGLAIDTPKKNALIFFVIVAVVHISIERFWGGVLATYLAPAADDDPKIQLLLTMLNPKGSFSLILLLDTAFSIAKLFLTAAIYFILFRLIMPTRAHFNLIFQVVAYGSAPLLLCMVPVIGSVVGFVWSIACTAVGCRYAMRLTWPQTLLGILPLYLIGIPIILHLSPF